MKIQKMIFGDLQTNCFIIHNGEHSVVVDPGDGAEALSLYLTVNNLKCKYVLLTHGHFDHVNGAAFLQNNGAKIYMHKNDVQLINSDDNLAYIFGKKFNKFTVDHFIEDNMAFNLNGLTFKAIHTPGHTFGGVCYILENCIFCGDTLFSGTVGRTDFPSGDSNQLLDSIRNKLFKLSQNYKLFCGHGEETALYEEKEHNPLC